MMRSTALRNFSSKRSFFVSTTTQADDSKNKENGNPPTTPIQTPKLVTSTPTTPKIEQASYKTVKHALQSSNFVTKTSYLITILSTLAALVIYYFYDESSSPEFRLRMAIDELNNPDTSVKLDGFHHLQTLYTTKRLFSGPVKLSISYKLLTSQDVIQALVNNITSDSAEVVKNSLKWLSKLLIVYSKFPLVTDRAFQAVQPTTGCGDKTNLTVMNRLQTADPGLTQLCRAIISFDESSNNDSWLLASNILLAYSCSKDAIVDQNLISYGVNKLLLSHNPVAMVTGARLYSKYFEKIVLYPDADIAFKAIERSKYHSHLVMSDSVQFDEENRYYKAFGINTYGASFRSIVGFSLLGAAWGKVAWFLSLHTSPAYFKAIKGEDAAVVKQWSKKFLLKRRVGLAVFTVMMFDYIMSDFLQGISSRPQELLSENLNNPLFIKSFPSIQVISTGLATLIAIKYQRFVILPLFLAFCYNHRDILSESFPQLNYLQESTSSLRNFPALMPSAGSESSYCDQRRERFDFESDNHIEKYFQQLTALKNRNNKD